MMWPDCEQPYKCKHMCDYINGKDIDGYDWCHVCVMDHYCFTPANCEDGKEAIEHIKQRDK